MSYIVQQGGRTDYNYKEVYIDKESELNTLSVGNMCPRKYCICYRKWKYIYA